MSALDGQLSDYLRVRRALGYKLARTEKLLAQFIAFLEERDERAITIENTLAWVTLHPHPQPAARGDPFAVPLRPAPPP